MVGRVRVDEERVVEHEGHADRLLAAPPRLLGVIQPPEVNWGSMPSSAHRYMRVAWWLVPFPGLATTLSVVGFNIFGDTVRDVLDPRMR